MTRVGTGHIGSLARLAAAACAMCAERAAGVTESCGITVAAVCAFKASCVVAFPLVFVAFALGVALAAGVAGGADCAHAAEIDDVRAEIADVRAEISDKTAELETLAGEIEEAEAMLSKLEKETEKLLDDLTAKQEEYANLQELAASLVTVTYKDNEDFDLFTIFNESATFEELLYRMEMRERVLSSGADMLVELHKARDELNASYEKVSKQADKQRTILSDMNDKQEKLNELVDELKEHEKELDEEQKRVLVEMAEAAARSHSVATTFATDFDDGIDDGDEGGDGDGNAEVDAAGGAVDDGWRTGIASAYGGKSDKMTPNPGKTATGTICDDWSVGVAVPMAWGPQQYYGRYVEISYGGQSVVAPVVDCGDMAGGERALDLQPGVFKAFGANTCSDWGLREVKYRFLT